MLDTTYRVKLAKIRQCWVDHLNPTITHYLPFSWDNDLLLWEGYKYYGWKEILTKLFHSIWAPNHVKNRWNSVCFNFFIYNKFCPDAYSDSQDNKAAAKDNISKVAAKDKREVNAAKKKAVQEESKAVAKDKQVAAKKVV